MVRVRALVLPLLIGVGSPAGAFVPGGGIANKDCRLAFGGVDATHGASQVLCTDGDACDADGAADGSCRFMVALCTGVSVPGCVPGQLTSLEVSGLQLEWPPLPSSTDTCAAPSEVVVGTNAAAGVTVIARDGRALKDVDYLTLCCVSGPAPVFVALCALTVSLEVAGCPEGALPSAAVAAFERARGFVMQTVAFPQQDRMLVQKAVKALRKVKRVAKRLSKRQPCGYALGLIATHAIETVRASGVR